MRKLKKPVKNTLVLLAVLLVGTAMVFGWSFYRNMQKSNSYRDTYETLTLEVDESQLRMEYGDIFDANKFVKSHNGELTQQGDINGDILGEQKVTFTLKETDSYNQEVTRDYEYTFVIEDTKAPVIQLKEDTVTFIKGMEIDLSSNIKKVFDEVDGEIKESKELVNNSYCIKSDINEDEAGEYTATITARDKNGIETRKLFKVVLLDHVDAEYPFMVRINRALNTVTVYAMDLDGEYSIPYKAMVCSTGPATPLGSYNTTINYRWRPLYGGVYGQYATRIVDDILFHSVPYYSQSPDDLESEEYNKLGTAASMGCIRLCVRDAKWIFDYCPIGTPVELYDDENDPGPLGKPEPITIDLTSENKGWDPTDPDPNNPWE